MALSAIALCGRALLKIGAKPLTGFTDGTPESEVAAALYDPVRNSLLSGHPWSFATAQARLARLEDAPVGDYQHAYGLPADFLRALSAGAENRGRGLDYRIAGRTLQTDSQEVLLTYIFAPDEGDVPPFFDMALMARLAAEFCIPLTENTSRADALPKLADAELRRARLIDSQQDTPPRFEDFTLIEARGP